MQPVQAHAMHKMICAYLAVQDQDYCYSAAVGSLRAVTFIVSFCGVLDK